jgi:serine/threonine protein kinase
MGVWVDRLPRTHGDVARCGFIRPQHCYISQTLPVEPKKEERVRVLGRYAMYDAIAAGGMATVHYGRLLGPVGFSRTVALKRLHAQFARDPEFVAMFIDEARLAARIRHPNVVQTVDVVAADGELLLVMDYVQGESLSRLVRASRAGSGIPVRVAAAIVCGALHGLHAAHEATDEQGAPLGLVHRDVTPQNILIGADGIARVLDFGVAKAAGRVQTTGQGRVKGKIGYMAPEQINGVVTRRTDVFAASVVLWEALTGKRLFAGDDLRKVLSRILGEEITPPTSLAPHLPPGIDAVVLKGLERDPQMRYATAREMALEVEACLGLASPVQVGAWVESLAHVALAQRAATLAEIESSSSRALDRSEVPSFASHASGVMARAAAQPPSLPALDSIPVVVDSAPARSRKVWFAAGAALLALVGIAGAATIHRTGPASLEGAPSPSPLAAPSAPPGGADPARPSATAIPAAVIPAAVSASVEPSRAEPSPPAASSTAAPEGAAQQSAAPSRALSPNAATPAPNLRRAPPPTRAVDCEPPYSLDAQGHKIWKEACFRK